MPTVTVRYFAVLRERRQRDHETLEVPEGTSLADLYAQLFPAPRTPVGFARNLTVVPGTARVEDGDEVAFLPPLGGG